ncbi:phosphate permease [Corynebacterium sp. HMSC22B11]|uniref:inorganic phosphate transporter n=1 Tax=Corynebacterium sp. HMSC22B11 TaxID=1581056 RepID=UPI0008A3F370|nr:inorganic phosphate transporter [Corynebacterium sp. HMSC22B11]OFO11807.1 phosphate permease [Corynebacterium sp. HMSC22B11]
MSQPETKAPINGSAAGQENDFWWHTIFGGLLLLAVLALTWWSVDLMPESANIGILIVTIIFGMFMAFNIGGNDVANSFGTSVGAKTLTIKQALLIAAIFEVGGALIAGGDVTDTVRSGIVDLDGVNLDPQHFAYIMMAALLGAALWLLIATRKGWPVSTTHSIIGGIVGAAVAQGIATGTGGLEMVQWGKIGEIAMSWVLSPVLGGVVALLLYSFIKRHVLRYNDEVEHKMREMQERRSEHRKRHKDLFSRLNEVQRAAYTQTIARDASVYITGRAEPQNLESDYYRELVVIEKDEREIEAHRALETWGPSLAALGAMIITGMLLLKSLSNILPNMTSAMVFGIVAIVGIAVFLTLRSFTTGLRRYTVDRATFVMFSWMQVFTASAFAFSHGSNDIANAVGPFAAIFDVLKTDSINATAPVPMALMLAAGVALISGLWFIGRKVIETVGTGLTHIHPASGFAAELAAAGVVMAASISGLPVSSTHILIGAVLGVGIVNRAANWRLMKPIALAWVITIPAAALIGAVGVLLIGWIF